MARLSKARLRGLYPEPKPIGYLGGPRVEVAISMDREDYDWLAGFVSPTGHVWCVEEALNQAVAAMKGDRTMAGHVEGIAWQHGVHPREALFGPVNDPQMARAADRLYEAARFVAAFARGGMYPFVPADELPDQAVLALAQAALGNECDLQAEIRRAQADLEAEYAEVAAEAHEMPAKPCPHHDRRSGDSDEDGISF